MMGGFGSGRTGGGACTYNYRSIDVRLWQRDGLLADGRWFNWQWTRNGDAEANINVQAEAGRVMLHYRIRKNGDDWQNMDHPVYLTTTPCNYGSERYWFICPAAGCGRRVALLYLGVTIFACRQCYRLAYKSQRETANDRVFSRADKIRGKLGWESGIANIDGDKPKGMHWRTFWRLRAAHDDHANQAMLGTMEKFKSLQMRLQS